MFGNLTRTGLCPARKVPGVGQGAQPGTVAVAAHEIRERHGGVQPCVLARLHHVENTSNSSAPRCATMTRSRGNRSNTSPIGPGPVNCPRVALTRSG